MNIMKQSIIVRKEFLVIEKIVLIFICRMNLLTLDFSIHAIQLKNQDPFSIPDCYHFTVKVDLSFYFKFVFSKDFFCVR
jgi:hypothetical protein